MFSQRITHTLGLVLFIALYACGGEGPDQRIGEMSRVRFTGGGGCNHSTAMAVGSTATLSMEPQEGSTLPRDLTVASTGPSITATRGAARNSVILTAHAAGRAEVELRDNGALWDRLTFSAEPAARVDLIDPSKHVLAGGTYVLKLGEIYGACGEDCPLMGSGFLRWSASPGGGLAVSQDVERTVIFAAGWRPGEVTLTGIEPNGGQALVQHKVAILSPQQVSGLTAEAVISPPREAGGELVVHDPAPLPPTVTVGSLFFFRLHTATAGGDKVMIWGPDQSWTVTGAAVGRFGVSGGAPEGPIFHARAPGRATLVGEVGLLGQKVSIDVEVVK
jgi:hypothetical protein